MKKKFETELRFLIFIFIFYLIVFLTLYFTNFTYYSIFKIIFGSFYFLFLPGYLISVFFFDLKESIEKIVISLSLSIVLVPFTMFILILLFKLKINFISLVLMNLGLMILIFLIKYFENSLNKLLKKFDKFIISLINKNKFLKKWLK